MKKLIIFSLLTITLLFIAGCRGTGQAGCQWVGGQLVCGGGSATACTDSDPTNDPAVFGYLEIYGARVNEDVCDVNNLNVKQWKCNAYDQAEVVPSQYCANGCSSGRCNSVLAQTTTRFNSLSVANDLFRVEPSYNRGGAFAPGVVTVGNSFFQGNAYGSEFQVIGNIRAFNNRGGSFAVITANGASDVFPIDVLIDRGSLQIIDGNLYLYSRRDTETGNLGANRGTFNILRVNSTAGVGNAYACVDSQGILFRSDIPCR